MKKTHVKNARKYVKKRVKKRAVIRKKFAFFQTFSRYKTTIDFVFSVIMSANTFGEWSDGEDDWIFEINEDGLFSNCEPTSNINEIIVISSDSEEDEPVSHGNETIVISSDSEEDEPVCHGNETIVISSDSEEDDPIPSDEGSNSEEDELEHEQTGRGVKRKAENQNVDFSDSEEDDPIPSDEGSNSEEDELEHEQTGRGVKRKAENQNVDFSDSEEDDPIPSDEGSNSEEDELEHEQTGRGVKRKAENQNAEQEQDYYQIKPFREHHSQKFNMTAKSYAVHFNNALDDVDLLESRKRTYGIFHHMIEDVTKDMNPNDQVRFVLRSDQLQTPISIPFCSLEELTVEKVLSHVEKVVQSNEDFRLNDTVTIDIIHVEMPRGSGRRKRTTLNIRDHLKKKKSVILINNKDHLCLARALAVSIARIEKDPRYKRMLDSLCTVQRERAFDLHEAANVPLGPCGLKEVDLFQQYLVNYQIIVLSGE